MLSRFATRSLYSTYGRSPTPQYQKRYLYVQYVSDLHVDHKIKLPNIIPKSKYLCICGDTGLPTHPNYDKLLFDVRTKFEKVFIIAGNHDYDCSSLYQAKKEAIYKPIIVDLCKQYDNVHFLDNQIYQLTDKIIVAGSVLWSQTPLALQANPTVKVIAHNDEFNKNLEWIQQVCNTKCQIIMMTHFVPTFRLIENKYMKLGQVRTEWFASNIDHLINKPIVGWICGHTHSVLETKINGVYCGVNAVGNHALVVNDRFVVCR